MKIESITAPNPGPFTLDGTRTWLLGETAVIDPGPDVASHIASILEARPRLDTILITHRHADHAPAAVPLAQRSGARILAPRGVLDDGVVARRLSAGDVIEVEGESVSVVATPGHTAEHVCYLMGDGHLFSGDTILGRGTTAIFPPDGDMADYLDSLRRLREYRLTAIHPAHGPDIEDPIAVIDAYIAHRLERERQVMAAVTSGASTIDDIREAVYPDLDAALAAGATAQITAHLIKLKREGRVYNAGGRYATASR